MTRPGDLVQLDTPDIRALPGAVPEHFTAYDMISRWDVVSMHNRATTASAAHFLGTLNERMPFRGRAIQVDSGSEFEAIFEEECQRGISSSLSGHRAHPNLMAV